MVIPEHFKQLYKVIGAGDADGFVTFLTDDARFRFGNGPEAIGRDNIHAAVSGFFGTIKEAQFNIIGFWQYEDTVIFEAECTYTRHDDSQVTIPFVNIFRMEADLIKDYLIYIDIAPLYAAGS